MGLDDPFLVQIASFFGALFRGDLGVDVWTGMPVRDLVLGAVPDTLLLIGVAIAWSMLTGTALGAYSAFHPGTPTERVASIVSIGLVAVPPFVVAIYVLLVFAVWLQWFPATGTGSDGGIFGRLHAVVLPAFALGLGWVGYIARIVRASTLEVLAQPHVVTARAFALPRRRLVLGWVLGLSIVPTVALMAASFGGLLSSAVLVEIVFARSGLGKLTYDAVLARNFPVVMGAVVVTTALYQVAVLAGDILVAWLDPRSRRR
jgi:peptide/nickel transport system permease protein